jgi:hypothetical protein
MNFSHEDKRQGMIEAENKVLRQSPSTRTQIKEQSFAPIRSAERLGLGQSSSDDENKSQHDKGLIRYGNFFEHSSCHGQQQQTCFAVTGLVETRFPEAAAV